MSSSYYPLLLVVVSIVAILNNGSQYSANTEKNPALPSAAKSKRTLANQKQASKIDESNHFSGMGKEIDNNPKPNEGKNKPITSHENQRTNQKTERKTLKIKRHVMRQSNITKKNNYKKIPRSIKTKTSLKFTKALDCENGKITPTNQFDKCLKGMENGSRTCNQVVSNIGYLRRMVTCTRGVVTSRVT